VHIPKTLFVDFLSSDMIHFLKHLILDPTTTGRDLITTHITEAGLELDVGGKYYTEKGLFSTCILNYLFSHYFPYFQM
jgi:hypothetical protein